MTSQISKPATRAASHEPAAKAGASSAHSKRCRDMLKVPELREAFGVRPACCAFGSLFQCTSDCWRWRLPTNRPLEHRRRGEKRVSRSVSECARPRAQQCDHFRRTRKIHTCRSSNDVAPEDGRSPARPATARMRIFKQALKREEFRRNFSPAALPSPEEMEETPLSGRFQIYLACLWEFPT